MRYILFIVALVGLISILVRMRRRPDLAGWLITGAVWLTSVLCFNTVSIGYHAGFYDITPEIISSMNNWSIGNQLISVIYVLVITTFFGKSEVVDTPLQGEIDIMEIKVKNECKTREEKEW